MTNNDVNKVKRKGTFKSAPLPEKVLAAEPPKGDELVKIAVAALEDVKAQDVLVIDVRDKQSITDFMIIATGTSNRQIGAMLDKVREAVRHWVSNRWAKKARATATGFCWTWTT